MSQTKVQLIADGAAVPTGAVFYFAANTAPTGYLKCNGDAVPNGSGTVQGVTTNFAALYAVLGSTYGAAGTLPDLRGEFARGWDDGRGVDTGRIFGSAQSGAAQSHTHTGSTSTTGAHTHTIDGVGDHSHSTNGDMFLLQGGGDGPTGSDLVRVNGTGGAGAHTHTMQSAGSHSHTFTTDSTGGSETRPRNISLLACIKY
jgi:microcystin-dependent protein